MPHPLVHLNLGWQLSACGAASLVLTDDAAAVNCPHCVSRMELQPA